MTMILQLLAAAVAVSLGVDAGLVPVPPYGQYVQEIKQAVDSLRKNVLSMEGNIPLLNDSRRHYAEIVHVINYHALADSGCYRKDYYENYQLFLNTSASEAIHNPEIVVTENGNLINDVDNRISEIEELIAACLHQNTELCDELIHDTVNENDEQYGLQSGILIVSGIAAKEFNLKNQKFEEVSNDFTAHQYVLTSPEDLHDIEDKLSNVHRVMSYPHSPKC